MAKLTKREKKKLNGIAKKHWKPLLVIAIILIILVAVAYYMGWIDLLINKFKKPVDKILYLCYYIRVLYARPCSSDGRALDF